MPHGSSPQKRRATKIGIFMACLTITASIDGWSRGYAQSSTADPAGQVRAEEARPQQGRPGGRSAANLDFTPIEGGQRMNVNPRSHDADIVADLVNSGNKENANLAALIKYVDAEGGIYGGMNECDPHKAALFRLCAFTILDHWRDITGRELPKTQMKDGYRTEAEIITTWRASAKAAAKSIRDSRSYCPAMEDAMRHSHVWRYCTEPDWDAMTGEADPASQATTSNTGQRER